MTFAIQKIKEEEERSTEHEESIRYIDPCIAHLIGRFDSISTCREIIEETEIKKSKITFITLNNNTNRDKAGGSHWSLLVYRKLRTKGEFLHFDPIEGMNRKTQHKKW